MSLPLPTPIDAVAHSPTPSIVRIAASLEGRRIERAGRVRLVVLGVEQLALVAQLAADLAR